MTRAVLSRTRVSFAVLLALAGGGTLFAQPPVKSASEKSYLQARQALDSAIKAMGGLEALQAIRSVSRKGSGTAFNQGQSLKPDAPYTTRPVETASVVDFAEKRSYSETATTPVGGILTKTRAVLKGDAGFALNMVTNVATPSTAPAVAAGKAAMRRDPSAILLTALGRAETLRFLGEETLDGQKHQVITFSDSDGAQIALYLNAQSGLLTKYEVLSDNPVLGDTLTEFVFSDYRPVEGVKLPFRVVTKNAGEVIQDLKYSEVRINTSLSPNLLEAPQDAERATPIAGSTTVTLTPLAEGVYFVGGSSHHSLFVVFGDHVLLVEAPQSDERSQVVMAKIKETAPNKPIKYVVPTHYHYDHSGGLRSYVAKGATIVTTPGNKSFIEKLVATAHTIRPDMLSREARKPVVETFTGKKVFTDGTRTVEVHDIGPNPHVTEAVIAYLPKEKIVFVSDLFTIPVQGPIPPASPATADFADKVKKLGLEVERIVPGHGRIGTMEDLRKALGAGGGSK